MVSLVELVNFDSKSDSLYSQSPPGPTQETSPLLDYPSTSRRISSVSNRSTLDQRLCRISTSSTVSPSISKSMVSRLSYTFKMQLTYSLHVADASIFNPSTITLITTDIVFGLSFEGQLIGSVVLGDLLLIPDANELATEVRYAPTGGASTVAGELLLANYVQGIVSNVSIVGTPNSSPYGSLQEALQAVSIQTTIPPLQQALITKACSFSSLSLSFSLADETLRQLSRSRSTSRRLELLPRASTFRIRSPPPSISSTSPPTLRTGSSSSVESTRRTCRRRSLRTGSKISLLENFRSSFPSHFAAMFADSLSITDSSSRPIRNSLFNSSKPPLEIRVSIWVFFVSSLSAFTWSSTDASTRSSCLRLRPLPSLDRLHRQRNRQSARGNLLANRNDEDCSGLDHRCRRQPSLGSRHRIDPPTRRLPDEPQLCSESGSDGARRFGPLLDWIAGEDYRFEHR